MVDINEFEEGQQLTEEEFKTAFNPPPKPKKEKAPRQVNPKDIVPDEIEPDEDYIEKRGIGKAMSMNQMQRAEEEVQKRQMVEYREKVAQVPESSVEMDSKLLEIEARMSKRKELMPAIDPSGIERNVAIELEEEYPEPFTGDMIKGNFGDLEMRSVFGNMTLINAMKTIGQAKDFSLVDACRFNKAQLDAVANISRAKSGFSAILVKTDKHVSEGVVQHVQKAFEERRQKRWGFF